MVHLYLDPRLNPSADGGNDCVAMTRNFFLCFSAYWLVVEILLPLLLKLVVRRDDGKGNTRRRRRMGEKNNSAFVVSSLWIFSCSVGMGSFLCFVMKRNIEVMAEVYTFFYINVFLLLFFLSCFYELVRWCLLQGLQRVWDVRRLLVSPPPPPRHHQRAPPFFCSCFLFWLVGYVSFFFFFIISEHV
jgi:hypothetical protein